MSSLPATPLLPGLGTKADRVIVFDLSRRTTKAVYVERKENGFALLNYSVREAPTLKGGEGRDLLAEHLKGLRQDLGAKTREVILVLGMEDSMLRNIETPPMEKDDLRRVVQLNPRHFFQQDMPGTVFDCFLPALLPKKEAVPSKSTKGANVLVGTAQGDLLGRWQRAAQKARLNLVQITPAQTGLANAALLAQSQPAHQETMMLLQMGAKTTSVSVLSDGTLALTRVIGIGSEQLASDLAAAHRISYPIAEDLKPAIIQNNVQNVLTPLAHEIRGAIDYFSDLQGKIIADGYAAGDLARSNLLLETLQVLEIPCRRLETKNFLRIEVPAEKQSQVEQVVPDLKVAIGAAAGWLKGDCIEINFVAEQLEEAAVRQRYPIRRVLGAGCLLALLLLLWGGVIRLKSSNVGPEVQAAQAELKSLEQAAGKASVGARDATRIQQTLLGLQQHATNRFLWALPLNALQYATDPDIQVVGLRIEQGIIHPQNATTKADSPAKPAPTMEEMLLTITAKNFADTEAEEKFIERLASLPYFKSRLRPKDAVMLKNRLPRQSDPLDPAKTFTLFTIECRYTERVLGYD